MAPKTTTAPNRMGSRAACATSAWWASCVASSELTMAMPRADPIMRTVVLAPLAAPARSAGTSDRMTLLSWEPAKPMPVPNRANPGSSCHRWMSGERAIATEVRPSASNNRPVRTTLVVPTRRVSQLPSWEPATMNSPDGTSQSPVRTADG